MTRIIFHEALLATLRKRLLLSETQLVTAAQILATDAPSAPDALHAWLRGGARFPGLAADSLAALLPTPEITRAFPGYRPLIHLASGGMGTIWLAASRSDELVVLKTLNAELRQPTPAPATRESSAEIWLDDRPLETPSDRPGSDPHHRLQRENRITRSLDHPHIVRCLDSGSSPDGELFLVLEFISGGDLKDLLDTHGPLSEALTLSLARQITAALVFASEAALVHRDLKPGNIFLAADGKAKLADFGFARSQRINRTLLTMAGSMLGSPLYMAPEQIAGATTLDGRCDQYGLGCVLFHCVAGKPPFPGTLHQVLRAHCVAPIPDLAALRPDLSPATVALVTRLLAKKPEERFAHPTALAAAITAAQQNLGLEPSALIPLPHRPHPPGTGETTISLPPPTPPTAVTVLIAPSAPLIRDRRLAIVRDGEVVVAGWQQERLVLGKLRGPSVDVCLRNYPEAAHRATDSRISRTHLAVSLTASDATLTDLGGANGTTCDGVAMVAHQPRALTPNTTVRCDLAQTLSLTIRALAARNHGDCALATGALDAVVIQRALNRPTLSYALIARALTIGGPGADVVIPQATTWATMAWSCDHWWWRIASSAWQPLVATTTWELGGAPLSPRPGREDDL